MYGIVAEGLPLHWSSRNLDAPPPRLARQAAFPILGFFAGPAVFQPNRLHPDARLVAGQRVIIAGYIPVAGAEGLPGFWNAPAAVVHARVLDASSVPSRPDRKDLLWLAAPAGDYRGFCGGPVGLEAPAGPARVVGVILFQHHDPAAGPGAAAILAAQGI